VGRVSRTAPENPVQRTRCPDPSGSWTRSTLAVVRSFLLQWAHSP
jgi:hypothetical protein